MTPTRTRCAVVQLCCTEDLDANLERAAYWVRMAARDGADIVTLPENFAWQRYRSDARSPDQPLNGPIVSAMSALARELGVHLMLGGMPEATHEPGVHHNAAVWLDRAGEIVGVYRKQHLFDIELVGQESHRESAHVRAGADDVCVDAEGGRFGLSICYDLRFPELYRRLVSAGATALTVPAAFTLSTGKDHWHTLLRARAIENQCYVIAAGQWGHHGGVRRSYGHSLVVDPWGTVIVEVPDGEGYAVAALDWERVRRVREQLPCLTHRRAPAG